MAFSSFIRRIFKVKEAGRKGDQTDPARGRRWDPLIPEQRGDHLRATQTSDHSAPACGHHELLQPEGTRQPLTNNVCPGQTRTFSQELRQGEGHASEMDGPWEECHVHGAFQLAEAMKFFVIENGCLTTAAGKAFTVNPGAKPNSIALGDGMIEMISAALLQIKTKDGRLAYFHRANLPPQDALLKLQGCWILGDRCTITIAGSTWTISGGRNSQGILRMHDGVVVLRDYKVEIRPSGKMRLTRRSGRVRKFTLQRAD